MTERDPRRLLEEEPEGMLRDGLEVARGELPTEEQMSSLASKLGPLLGGPEGGGWDGGGAPSAAPSAITQGATLGKAALALLAVGTVGAGVWLAMAPPAEDPPSEPPTQGVGHPTPPDDAPPTPPSPTESSTIPTPKNLPTHFREPDEGPERAPRKRVGRSREESSPGEVSLLQRAQDALADSPARTLALAEEHRRHHPEGVLAQEREVLAIDALVRLGRPTEARARADRFRDRYPRSAQLRRIETLLAE